MSNIDKIKELRELTGVSIGQCKVALEKADGDITKAIDVLRTLGTLGAQERRERKSSEGRIETYVHGNGRVGVLLQVNCESDFVARSEDFKEFMHEICLQIAAMRPLCVNRDVIPAEKVQRETQILKEQAASLTPPKPEAIQEKMVKGQLEKWFNEICLVDQAWVKDNSRKISDLLNALIQKTGENICIVRFARFEAGVA